MSLQNKKTKQLNFIKRIWKAIKNSRKNYKILSKFKIKTFNSKTIKLFWKKKTFSKIKKKILFNKDFKHQ